MQTSYMGPGPGPGRWAGLRARVPSMLPSPGPGSRFGAHVRCLHFLCICVDFCIFVDILVYQVYRANGLR